MDQHIDTPHLYPATLSPEPEGGFTVTFRDLPEAITYGVDDGEARTMAVDVLELAIAERMARGQDIPTASGKRAGDVLVPIRPLLAAKAALHCTLARDRVSKSDLARRLGVDAAVVRRMLHPRRATRIDNVALALSALGVTLQVTAIEERRSA